MLRSALCLALLISWVAAQPALVGPYTINPALPPSATNFSGLDTAMNALGTSGVSGPVVFEVYDDGGAFGPVMTASWSPGGDGLSCMTLGQWTGVSATNTVTIRAAFGEIPVLDAMGSSVVVSWNGADYVTLEGLELRGALHDAVNMYTPGGADCLDNTITRNRIHGCGGCGVLFYGNSGPVVNTLITNNLLYDLQMTGGGSFSNFIRDGYLCGRRDTNTRIIHNTLLVTTLSPTSNATFAIGEYHGGSATQTGITQIQGNLIVKTATVGTVYFWRGTTTVPSPLPAICDNNCLYDPSTGNLASLEGVLIPDLPNWALQTGLDTTSLDVNPQFANPVPNAFRLSGSSPCVSGSVSLPEIMNDFEGDARDLNPDIGCDELGIGGTPTVTSIGVGCSAGASVNPTLSTTQLPSLGNAGFTVILSGGAPASVAEMFASVGFQPVPFDLGGGCRLYLEPVTFAAVITLGVAPIRVGIDAMGFAAWNLPVPASWTGGTNVTLQAAIADSAAPLGFTTTNALDLVIF